MSLNPVPFFEMFSGLGDNSELRSILGGAAVLSAEVNTSERTMSIKLKLDNMTPPAAIWRVQAELESEYELKRVDITPLYPPEQPKEQTKKVPKGGQLIFGRSTKGELTSISDVNLESGRVVIRGDIFSLEVKEITKTNSLVLNFDITDYTGSVRVSKYITDDAEKAKALNIKKGMYVKVKGTVGFNRYDNDISITPEGISLEEKVQRKDTSEKKRVELHLHTQMSAMDALTDTKKAINRAISWGHPAIAITDHGVCQSFPDAMKAAGDKIKVIYGVEGYYINDVDDRLALYGNTELDLDTEIVAFDIETTGLDSCADRITEIGAVIMKGNKELARFQTFVDPEMPIPANIIQLTGITNEDVKGAPSQRDAVKSFLEFAGGRPLAAHNASFDIGFIYQAVVRYGLDFEPVYIDTLALSQGQLSDMKNHKLDMVAGRLGLPEFNHHRASDDAVTAGLILVKLFERAKEDGINKLSQLNPYIQAMRNSAMEKRRFKPKHIIILAKTQAGIRNLYKLVTAGHLDHFKRYPIIPKSVIQKHRDGLIIGAACEAGEVFQLVSDNRSVLEQRRIADFYDYLEIQPICNNMFMLRGDKPKAKDIEDLRRFNRRVIELGKELGKPVVATGDVHFLDPEDEVYRHILLTAKEFDDADSDLPIYFRTTNEMLDEFSYLGKELAEEVVITNPNLIADMCDVTRPLPPKILYAPKIENSAEDLKRLVYTKMTSLYGENPPEIVKSRVDTELNDILARNYDVIYMSAQKLVADSLEHGYLVGSRGSVGSSLVAYMSGITEVNSLPAHYRCPNCLNTDFESGKGFGCGADMPDANCPVCGIEYSKEGFDIPFETFLGFGGDKVPDIDLNFSGEYQANAHKYTNELFGSDHVFRAGTIGTVAEKTAYGYVKKYLEKIGKTVTKVEETRLALGCVGVKRTTGQHPGGLVVIPQDMEIFDFCPAQHPADSPDSGIVTTHFEYHCMEDNLLKLDELGHDDPTMIKMLEDMSGEDAKKIALDDPETMGIFKSAIPLGLTDDDPIIGKTGTIGIPEFGTGFTRQMLCDTKPECFDTLVRLSGFSHGTDVWLGNAKDLILSETASISETIGCRDDIMLYLISKGMNERRAFKIMEAVRKGRGLPEGAEDEMKEIEVPEWYIESCKKIKYLFPKAHAVAYVMMAFRIAWFKVHKPLAFYSAYFYRRSQKDSFDASCMIMGLDVAAAKIREIKGNPAASQKDSDLLTTLEACYEFYKRGYEFAPMDIYKSDPVKFVIDGNKLIPPLVAVSGLGETAAYDLGEQRKNKTFLSIEELLDSCAKISKMHIEQLRAVGALDELPDTSQLSLF
ncbi:MAG: PolC-type DNA polymerase III [Ruminococcaceae bacterium]|nr:PolC-type DNA polymerase III [Oscillospiraceae bacterium]